MTIIDTSALLAFFRADDPSYPAVDAAIKASPMLVISPFVLAEVDYFVGKKFGPKAQSLVLEELSSGRYELPVIGAADLITCRRLIDRYVDLAPGLTDVSLVVLADRYRTNRIITLDRRDFSVLRSLDGHPFELLP